MALAKSGICYDDMMLSSLNMSFSFRNRDKLYGIL